MDFSPVNLKEISKSLGVYQDAALMYLYLSNAAAVEEVFSPWIMKRTEEIRLQDLGRFPLAASDEHLIEASFTDTSGGEEYYLPSLLKAGRMPVFFTAGKTRAIIPVAGQKVCRYFYDLWEPGFDPDEPLGDISAPDIKEVLFGFCVISSFAPV